MKSVAYSSQGNHTCQWNFCSRLMDDSTMGCDKVSFINYLMVPREGEVGKISTYSYFGEGVKSILT